MAASYHRIHNYSDSEAEDCSLSLNVNNEPLAERTPVIPEEEQLSMKLRVFAFIMCGLNITFQYLYYTAPIAFLTNEIIQVVQIGRASHIFVSLPTYFALLSQESFSLRVRIRFLVSF